MQKLYVLVYNNLFFKLKMGNGEFEVPRHVKNQWVEVNRNNKKYLKNKITLEEFEYIVLEKPKESQDISLLIERSIYSIPKTPKVIILNDQKGKLSILVQECDQHLAQHIPKILLTVDVLELLSQTLKVFHCLLQKYGSFEITEGMIGLTKNFEVIAWINENKQKNQAQLPIQSKENAETIMISQIFGVFKKHSRSLFQQQELFGSKSFESVQIQLNKMIKKKKIEIASNSIEVKSKVEGFRRALSPQTSFGSFRHIQIKSPKAIQSSSKICKRSNIPNFLKRIADKKANFLDNVHHKRTVTIDQTQKQVLSKQKKIQDLKVLKRQTCSSKSLNKLKCLKVSPNKDRNSNFSGQISKLSFPTTTYTEKTFDFLTQSGSSSNCMFKKREFQDQKATKNWKFQSFTLKNTKNNFQSSPTYTENKPNYWQVSGKSHVFQPPQNHKPLQSFPTPVVVNLKVPLLTMCNNTSVSNYFNEAANKQKEAIIEQQSPSVSKTLQDEFNDFFSNHSKSPRFMLQALPQSHQLTEQFSRIIDF